MSIPCYSAMSAGSALPAGFTTGTGLAGCLRLPGQTERPLQQLRVLSETLAVAYRTEPPPSPVWGNRKTIGHLIGISGKKPDQLRLEGVVRAVRLSAVGRGD